MRKITYALLLALIFICPTQVFAEEVKVSGVLTRPAPESGGGCIPTTGQVNQCTGDWANGSYAYEDDGFYQMGSKVTPRWADGGTTITDNVTGLMWVKDGSGPGCNNGVALNWAAAINFCNNLGFAGYSDWRLPNVNEMLSIVDFGNSSGGYPMLYSVFPNAPTGYWRQWTSTSVPDMPTTYAYAVGVGIPNYWQKASTAYFRPVRDAQM